MLSWMSLICIYQLKVEELKNRIINYWTRRADGFEAQRLREFDSLKHGIWLQEIESYLPDTKPLKILDIGTGTGFFSCLMAERGHDVTGIDLTPDMVKHAEHMANLLHCDATFAVMDAQSPDFAPESFDVLLTRNLTWTLPDVQKAYQEWYQLLKTGGVLINFDADYYVELDKELDKTLPAQHAHMLLPDEMMQENEAITRLIGEKHLARPKWDIQLLLDAGYERIYVDTGAYKRIYKDMDEFYNPAALFMIVAYK